MSHDALERLKKIEEKIESIELEISRLYGMMAASAHILAVLIMFLEFVLIYDKQYECDQK